MCNIWLGELYSMLSISLRFWHADLNLPMMFHDNPFGWADFYCQTAEKCLTLGDVTNPRKGTLEASIMFLHAGFTHNTSDITRTWLMAGDILRLAMRMGYHRDPSQYPHLSAFEGEMRRRVFQFVYQTDLLCSFQIGLTSAIRGIEYDAQPSHNFHEHQLTPTMAALPPSLDDAEPTYHAYFIAQNRLFRVFGDIVEQLNVLGPLPYSKVLDLSKRLQRAFEQIPAHLKRTLPDSVIDPPRLILQRIELEVFYHKVNCVLHRRYMMVRKDSSEYAPSRELCVESALRLLNCQVALHNNERWPHVEWWTSTFTLHDFTLAATLLCLFLSKCKEEAHPNESIAKVKEALATSHALWSEVRDTSPDAKKAFDILDKLRSRLNGSQSIPPGWNAGLSSSTINHEEAQNLGWPMNGNNSEDPIFGFDFGATDLQTGIDWVGQRLVHIVQGPI